MNCATVFEQYTRHVGQAHMWHVDKIYFSFLYLSTHSVQETDGSYFESFTALAWKRENRRMSAVRIAETRAETLPENERDPQADEEIADSPEQKEQLYIDVLYTIANSVGAPAPGGQVKLQLVTADKNKFTKLDSIGYSSLPITRRRCTCRRNVHSAFPPIVIIVSCTQPPRRNRRSSS